MKHKKRDLDRMINDAARGIREELIDDSIINQSASTVWARINQKMANENSAAKFPLENLNMMNANDNVEQINGCAGFQSLIPAYLGGKLSTARRLLLEDHKNECVSCRRAINEQRAEQASKSATFVVQQPASRAAFVRKPSYFSGWSGNFNKTKFARLSVAVALVVCLGIAGLFVFERFDWSGRTLAATLENVDGAVFAVSDQTSRPLTAGEQIQKGERVRTAKDSNALLRLADGSTIEMRERSEFSVSENRRGVTVNLSRGDVIVEAAKQRDGRLYVQTPDSLVSVKGTIFAVESGTKGSRVSVVEGEVEVNSQGKDQTLLPGDQTTTNPNLNKTSVRENVAWSRNAAKYTTLVSELAKLRTDINERVPRPDVRYSSKLINLVPADAVFYAALPNLTKSLAESEQIMHERINQNPALAEWWKSNRGKDFNEQTLARVREFGERLGDEIVVSAAMNQKGEPDNILVLGEVKNAADFRGYLDNQLARLASESGNLPNVRVVDDPLTAAKNPAANDKNGAAKNEVFVWIHDDVFAASPQIETLRELATNFNSPDANRFANSSFHQRISDVYRDGAGIVVAADLEHIIAQSINKDKSPDAERRQAGLEKLGVMNLRHFIVEQKESNGKTLSRAALTFAEPNRGIASWLAAPGSMGALDFISPNANVATAFVVKKPELLVDDLFGVLETVNPELRQQIRDIETQQGFSIRNDFAAPLGGEFAFALDGPILPTPSWKVVLEVYDQPKLQQTFERAVEKLNQFSALHGKGKLVLESETANNRTFYSIKSVDAGLVVYYTYANGYLVAAPSRALLDQSLNNRDAGQTLVRSSRFMSALPADGNANFSAIFYHDLAPLIQPLAERIKNAGGETAEKDRQTLAAFDANQPPTLVYAYAEGDRLTLAANTEGGAFGLSPASLIGLPNSFEMQNILSNAMNDQSAEKK